MERAVRENDFVIAVCTPRFQEKSDDRSGGVGYEGDIMTAYAFTGGVKKKFIPVLRRGSWSEAAPTWLLGRAKIDLSGDPYSESEYEELLRTLHGAREEAPPIGHRPNFGGRKGSQASAAPALVTPLAGSSTPQQQLSVTPDAIPKVEGEFPYDAYISYVDRGTDADFVWDTLVPKLESAGLKVAVSGDSADPGVPRIVGGERAICQAKRIVIVLSEAYLDDSMADFESALGQTMSIEEGSYRLLPLKITSIATDRLPVRLGMLETLDLTNPRRADRSYERLIKALQGPLPTR
jgi:hypothetical protein